MITSREILSTAFVARSTASLILWSQTNNMPAKNQKQADARHGIKSSAGITYPLISVGFAFIAAIPGITIGISDRIPKTKQMFAVPMIHAFDFKRLFSSSVMTADSILVV